MGGIQVGKERLWTLAYADDLILMAKSGEEKKEMIKRLEKYLKNKKTATKHRKIKNIMLQKRKKQKEKNRMEMEKREARRSSRIQVLKLCIKKTAEGQKVEKEE